MLVYGVVASRMLFATVGEVGHRLLQFVRRRQAEVIIVEVCSHLGRSDDDVAGDEICMWCDGIGRSLTFAGC